MPTLQIRNMPQELYDLLKDSAEISNRSLTQEVIILLKKALFKDNDRIALRKRKAIEKIKKQGGLKTYSSQELELWIREDRER